MILKAELWIGLNILGYWRVGSRLEVGAIPIEPVSDAVRSERISVCYICVSSGMFKMLWVILTKLIATIVSKLSGFNII